MDHEDIRQTNLRGPRENTFHPVSQLPTIRYSCPTQEDNGDPSCPVDARNPVRQERIEPSPPAPLQSRATLSRCHRLKQSEDEQLELVGRREGTRFSTQCR